MKVSRKLVLCLALVVSVAMATGSTLAYLTDTATKTNTFTLGNVKMELTEPNWDKETEHSLLPGVGIDKDPTIKNTGDIPAWVWMTVSIPEALYNHVDLDYKEPAWSVTKGDVVNGNQIVIVKLQDKLAAGASATAFTKVTLDSSIDADDEGNLLDATGEPINWNVENDPKIVVTAYAIQEEPFQTVDAAYNAYNGKEDGEEDSEPEQPTQDAGTYEDLVALFDNAATTGTINLTKSINLQGKSIAALSCAYDGEVVFNGNGHKIYNGSLEAGTSNGMLNYGLFYVATGSSLTVKNLLLENITVDSTNDTERNYGAAVVIGYADGESTVNLENVDVKNCSVTNTTDEAAVYIGYTTGNVTMTNCDSTGCAVQGEETAKTSAFIGHLNGGTATLTNCTTDLTIGACNRNNGTLTVN